MDIAKTLRSEIRRRGLRPIDVSRMSQLPYATISEFMSSKIHREIGVNKASVLMTCLGLYIARRKK